MRITLIIPVYNEEKYLGEFIKQLQRELQKLSDPCQVLFIDDGSTDQTPKILANSLIKNSIVISSPHNLGKGASMKIGFQKAQTSSDAIIFMDADLQHDPQHIHEFIATLKDTSLVFGYRKLSEDAPFIRKLGNEIVRYVFRTLFNIRRYDLLCGFIAIRKDRFDIMHWKSKDYGVELELAMIVGKRKLPFKEILIHTIYLDTKKGLTIFDAALILIKIPFWYLLY